MKVITLILIPFALVFSTNVTFAYHDAAQKTMSPFFQLAGRDVEMERFFLQSTRVKVTISGVIAHVSIAQHYTNRGNTPIQGSYIFPGSSRSAVHGLKMTVGQRVTYAAIKEKEEAKKLFTRAQKQGKTASLLEQKRPNVFQMEVTNIMPGDLVKIELQYTEVLIPTAGMYSFIYPTVVGPRYSTSNDIPPSAQWFNNPYLEEGAESPVTFNIEVELAAGMPVQSIKTPSHQTHIKYKSESTAQINLVDPSRSEGDRDFTLHYRLSGGQIATGLMLYKGEKENFFLCMVQPPQRVDRKIMPPREYIFTIDVSGSMNGFPLDTAKQLLTDLIGNLRPEDSFNIILFAGSAKVMAPESVPATEENISRALHMISRERGGGGTELLDALQKAMKLPALKTQSRTILVITDGFISAEREVFSSIHKNLDQANVFAFGIGSSVNHFLIQGIAKAGRGDAFTVTDPDKASGIAKQFREYIQSPVLTDINLSFQGLDTYAVVPESIPDLFASRPVLVFGKWRGKPEGSYTLSGQNGNGRYGETMQIKNSDLTGSNKALPYLWARHRISALSDFSPHDDDRAQRKEITSLGLTYNLLTKYTSFVAVDDLVRNHEGPPDVVKQPLPLPKGVSRLAVGYSMAKVPEPELKILLLFLVAFTCYRYTRKRKTK